MARQTPQQKRANEAFAKVNEKRMGKPESSYKKKDAQKSPVGPVVIGVLVFVVVVPILLEFLKIIPSAWDMVAGILAKIGVVKS